MFVSFALLLPFSICLVCTLVFFFKRHRDTTQQLMLLLDVLCAIFFFVDSVLINASSESYGWFSVICLSGVRQFLGPILLPVLLLFVRSMRRTNYYSWTTGFWFIPAVMLGSICFVLVALMGLENASVYFQETLSPEGPTGVYATSLIYRVHYLFSTDIYGFVMLAEMLYLIGYLVYLMVHTGYSPRSLLKILHTGGSVPVVNLLSPVLILFLVFTGVRLGVGRSFLLSHLAFAATCNFCMGALILVVNFLALFANRSPVTLRMLRSPLSMADSNKKYHYAAENEGNKSTPIEGMNALSYAELVDGFKALVMVERVFLESAITIEDVSMRLHSNRTYVSCMISKEFNMNFRDYMSSFRIDYAKKYMKSHPAATQDEVAQASGFNSASTFNKKFRQVEGISPRQWQINN